MSWLMEHQRLIGRCAWVGLVLGHCTRCPGSRRPKALRTWRCPPRRRGLCRPRRLLRHCWDGFDFDRARNPLDYGWVDCSRHHPSRTKFGTVISSGPARFGDSPGMADLASHLPGQCGEDSSRSGVGLNSKMWRPAIKNVGRARATAESQSWGDSCQITSGGIQSEA
jgi:hypothetical protein